MLKSIDPLLNADLLHVLRAMGHGDDLALVDCNFPATSVAGNRPLIRLDGVDIPRAGKAILSVFPLDSFVEQPARRMEMVGIGQWAPSNASRFTKRHEKRLRWSPPASHVATVDSC